MSNCAVLPRPPRGATRVRAALLAASSEATAGARRANGAPGGGVPAQYNERAAPRNVTPPAASAPGPSHDPATAGRLPLAPPGRGPYAIGRRPRRRGRAPAPARPARARREPWLRLSSRRRPPSTGGCCFRSRRSSTPSAPTSWRSACSPASAARRCSAAPWPPPSPTTILRWPSSGWACASAVPSAWPAGSTRTALPCPPSPPSASVTSRSARSRRAPSPATRGRASSACPPTTP